MQLVFYGPVPAHGRQGLFSRQRRLAAEVIALGLGLDLGRSSGRVAQRICPHQGRQLWPAPVLVDSAKVGLHGHLPAHGGIVAGLASGLGLGLDPVQRPLGFSVQHGLVLLEGHQIVATLVHNLGRNGGLAAQRIEADEHPT